MKMVTKAWPIYMIKRYLSSNLKVLPNNINLLGSSYTRDDYTNVTDRIAALIGRNLHLQKCHPLNLVQQRIVNYFYKTFVNSRQNPQFSVFNNLSPIVSVTQNFDSLLIPENHPSRAKSDCYYINREYLLRAHMTAHQSELLLAGLNDFLMIGDVYRRDEIDRTHYPVFHQLDAVRLRTRDNLFPDGKLELFESGNNTSYIGAQEKQPCHTLTAVKLMEQELKSTLEGLAICLFGNVQFRWVDTQFPFTQPSWELEVFYKDDWLELLGCGIMKQAILTNSGVTDRIGWAFGLGLERVAMCLYQIPDIRLFWSKDSGFLSQFKVFSVDENIKYKEISQFPQCTNDISFWLPNNDQEFSNNDFYDLVRSIGGDMVEQVQLIDNFIHPKTKKTSHCYRIIYRHMHKTLTQAEVNVLHAKISETARQKLGILIR
ncbi:hypothetical protein ABEB36_003195 [Hypothenemus hampei]|uniref:Phenylalanine--tRNA ligase, mitochondrial n=1 Tax=Hypothenemus hampei TaxID=57062 RepID=A0ABD1FBH9_HYPHA